MTATNLEGVVPALVTPFDTEDRVDEAALRRLVEYVIDGGVHAIMTTGGTGEFPSLSRDERKTVTAISVEAAANRVPIIAGTAACSTKETIQLSQDAIGAGAQHVIVTAPFYFPLPESALRNHYRAVADAVAAPVIAYNNPAYTNNRLSPRLLAILAEDGVITALKQSESNLGELVELIALVGDRLRVLTGIDSQFVPALSVGACGIFSTAAGAVPRLVVDIYDAYTAGDHESASRKQIELQPVNRFFEYEPGYVAPCKRALEILGQPAGPVRPPLPSLTADEDVALASALESLRLATG